MFGEAYTAGGRGVNMEARRHGNRGKELPATVTPIEMTGISRGASALLLLLVLAPPGLAAEALAPFEPIAAADLALKDNPADPGAAAMILLDEVTTRDDKRYESHHRIIKIFTNEGRRHANVELYYLERHS